MESEATDTVLATISRARPNLDAKLASPAAPAAVALLEEILRDDGRAPSQPRIRWHVVSSAAAAVAIALASVAISTDSAEPGRAAPGAGSRAAMQISPESVRHIASVSSSTLAGTGKADVVFRLDAGRLSEQAGSGTLTFSGDDLEMVFRFAGREGRPGFETVNRTVDGGFYLLDGPPDAKRWYLDTNAPATRGSDLFTVDPRTIVSAIHPDIEFVDEGTEETGGVELRQLRATRPERLPALNLGFGPIETTTIDSFDVWVDESDVVRRLDLTTVSVETQPASATKVLGEDGRTTVVTSAETTTVEHRASYSVRFYALGEPIEIEAPADAIPVAGQG